MGGVNSITFFSPFSLLAHSTFQRLLRPVPLIRIDGDGARTPGPTFATCHADSRRLHLIYRPARARDKRNAKKWALAFNINSPIFFLFFFFTANAQLSLHTLHTQAHPSAPQCMRQELNTGDDGSMEMISDVERGQSIVEGSRRPTD